MKNTSLSIWFATLFLLSFSWSTMVFMAEDKAQLHSVFYSLEEVEEQSELVFFNIEKEPLTVGYKAVNNSSSYVNHYLTRFSYIILPPPEQLV